MNRRDLFKGLLFGLAPKPRIKAAPIPASFSRLYFTGQTASFPALKRTGEFTYEWCRADGEPL